MAFHVCTAWSCLPLLSVAEPESLHPFMPSLLCIGLQLVTLWVGSQVWDTLLQSSHGGGAPRSFSCFSAAMRIILSTVHQPVRPTLHPSPSPPFLPFALCGQPCIFDSLHRFYLFNFSLLISCFFLEKAYMSIVTISPALHYTLLPLQDRSAWHGLVAPCFPH